MKLLDCDGEGGEGRVGNDQHQGCHPDLHQPEDIAMISELLLFKKGIFSALISITHKIME